MNSKLSIFTKILVLTSLLYCSSCNNSRKCALNNRLFVKVNKKNKQKFKNESAKIKCEKRVYSFNRNRDKYETYNTNENIAENHSTSQQNDQIYVNNNSLDDNTASQMKYHSVESYINKNTPHFQLQNKLENDKKDKQSLRIKTFSKIGLALAISGFGLGAAGVSLGLIWIPLITIGAFAFFVFEIIALVFSVISYCTIRNKIDEDIQNEHRLKKHKRMSIAGIILGSIFLYIALLLALVVLFVYLL